MAITEHLAVPEGTDTGQPEEAAAEAPGPGGRSPRERFDQLPKHLKAKILEKHRDYNTHHRWWDSVYDSFTYDMAQIGIGVDRMYFSGFCSQGDGACFEGHVRDWTAFLKSVGYSDAALIKHATAAFSFAVHHRGHYYHENCTSFDADLPLPASDADEWFLEHFSPYQHDRHSLHEAVWMAIINKYDSSTLEREFIEAFKGHMQTLYGMLEEEYEQLTSDEAILDSLEVDDQLEDAINDAMEIYYA